MTQEERRAAGIGRVPVQTLVELCGIDPGKTPAFEGQSLDLSGRGMHVRTAYLPPIGTQLVCRFEERGREIIAEGVVAWRSELSRGGEFGLMFTALDSGSVEALRELTGLELGSEAEPDEGRMDPDASPAGEPVQLEAGARVRLHIDGLGAPMKALVKKGSRSRVKVGSNLEFLKVGRKLQIESLEAGERRVAEIDGIDVVIEPQSGVPQLVVALHYEDIEDVTPEPSVIDEPVRAGRLADAGPARMEPRRSMGPSGAPTVRSAPVSTASELEPDLDDDFEPEPLPQESEVAEADEEPALRGRAGVVATRAGHAAKEAGAKLALLSSGAAQGLGTLFKSVGAKVAEAREKRALPKQVRRTAPPPAGVMSPDGRRLRPQTGGLRSQSKPQAPAEENEPVKPKLSLPTGKKARRVISVGAGAALLGTVALIALNRPAQPPGAEVNPAQSVTVAARDEAATADPAASARQAKVERLKEPPPAGSTVVADVPLFGPTPMATLEPAPLEAPPAPSGKMPELQAALEEDGVPAAKMAQVPDEVFEEPPAEPAGPNPEEVKPWGRGKVNTPTLHRLRLDGAGTAIQGGVTATGFSVVIPGRKVMETGEAIAKRDKRIARVSTKNSPQGAQVTFSFRENVPGYRVRLRRDFIEFLVSAPDKS